jgi:hypothetical protein
MKRNAGAVAVLVVALLLASGLYFGGPGSPMSARAPTVALTTDPAVPRSSAAAAHPPPTLSSSGRGSFFLNYPQPTAPTTNPSCAYLSPFSFPTCTNSTGNPTINVTSTGRIATAYTAFAAENPCSAASNLTESVIGVDTSANGSVWNAPVYLDNPVCSDQFNYTSAMMPSLTSLSNGTLVLAYIEYNLSVNATSSNVTRWCQGIFVFPNPTPCAFTDSRLVVTESYNNGTTWNTPDVIVADQNTSVNASGSNWIPTLPSISATGNTVYLAWSNYTNASFGYCCFFPGESPPPPSLVSVDLVSSANGGTSWTLPVTLPTVDGFYDSEVTSVAYAPSVTVAPNGTLFVAYSSNLTADDNFLCNPFFVCSTLEVNQSMDVVVAQSTNNGTTYSLSTAASAVPVFYNGYTSDDGYPNPMFAPTPYITLDRATGQVYVAYAGGEVGNQCFGVNFCFSEEGYENVWLSSSTNDGGTWNVSAVGNGTLALSPSGANNSEFLMTPSVGVGTGGAVYVNAVYNNDTVCVSFGCDQWTDLEYESTDDGATWSAPAEVDPANASVYTYDPIWDGFTTSMTMVDGVPWFAWTQQINPVPGSVYCFGWTATCYSQVIVSTIYTGTGLTTTFKQTGLPSGYNWSVDFAQNLRGGSAATSLSVSGVPPGDNVSWSIPSVNSTTEYGILYVPVTSPVSPVIQSGNLSVTVTFVEEALLNLTVIPPTISGSPYSCADPYYGAYPYDCANQNITPTVGLSYLPVGVPLPYGVAPIAGFTFTNCYDCLNLSFLAWNGVGNGSWNSTHSNGTTTVYGPINETVSFNVLGYCSYGVCNNATYNYTFFEQGLPAGTPWTITFGNQTESSATTVIGFNGTGGPVAFTVWDVPFNATEEYVGLAHPGSPITAVQDAGELVNFTLTPITAGASELAVAASGLPAGVDEWGFDLGSVEHASPASGAVYTVPNVPVKLNASSVYGPAGVGAYPTGFSVTPEITGAKAAPLALGGTLNVSSPVSVIAEYAPEYWLTVANSSGGTVTGPAGQWVHRGETVNLTATPLAGFAFVGWSGTGGGSVTSTSRTISVPPTGPVSELATFVAVVPTFSVSVTASGLSSAVPVTVSIGGASYTEVAPFVISGLLTGSYALTVPTVYPNGTAGERFVTTSVTSSLSLSAGSLDVTTNGTLTLVYSEQVTLDIAGNPNGTTSPAAGLYWETAGVAVPLTATPNVGFLFVSWNGTGLGSVTTDSAASTHVTPTGPVTEAAVFALKIVPPPPTFSLTITETGLPTGTTWTASIGANGASGTGALVISGLNGSYVVLVANVLGSVGVRYVPANLTGYPADVTANRSLSVTFTTQYAVTVSTTPGGTVSPSSEWVNSGSAVTLTATPNASYQFDGWSGAGTGSYTGTTAQAVLTVTSPVSEVATFVPASSVAKPSSSSGVSWTLPIALLVVLLVVGLAVGLLLGRSRRPPEAEGPATTGEAAGGAAVPEWSEGPESAPAASEPSTDSGGADDSIYGGSPP